MNKFDPQNERLKLEYQGYLRHVHGLDHKTIDKAMSSIRQFEESTGFKSFKKYRTEQAAQFKDWLDTARNSRTGKPLSPATIGAILRGVGDFIRWAAGRRGYKKAIDRDAWTYFRQPLKDARIANTPRPRAVPSVEQVARAFDGMPGATSFQKRDRAVIALLILTGARIGAVASLRLKHLDLERRTLLQDAREVNTKAAKSVETTFFPMGEQYFEAIADYVTHLKHDLLFGPEDALFPKAEIKRGPNGFEVAGLSRRPYASSGPLTQIVKNAFAAVQLPLYTPHSFRHMLALHGDKVCKTLAERKACSQNLGHENLATTVNSYMPVSPESQREIILRLGD